MSSDILASMKISASGMRAQGTRIRMITENVANADTTAKNAGGDPYRRKFITFVNETDKASGASLVRVDDISKDMDTEFPVELRPDHPAADANGYVKLPNVDMLVEIMDSREAQRSYEANLKMIEQARGMMSRTIDLLRN